MRLREQWSGNGRQKFNRDAQDRQDEKELT
jgi:hypothetical protein